MSSPNKLTLNTNPLQYKRARSKGVNKISKISKVSKIKKIATNNKNTENMAYSPFKMKGPSLYKSPAKKYNSPAKDTRYFSENDMGPDGNMNAVVKHNEKHERDPKWNHEKKKETKASPAKHKVSNTGNFASGKAHNEQHAKNPDFQHGKKVDGVVKDKTWRTKTKEKYKK